MECCKIIDWEKEFHSLMVPGGNDVISGHLTRRVTKLKAVV